jgi:cytochrome c556
MFCLKQARVSSRTAIVLGCAAVLAVSLTAAAQDQATLAKDAIFARKILMDTIGTNMDELETMTTSDKGVNLTEGHEHADNISVMLMAFPHLFAPNTNQWKPNANLDPGRDTFAAPEVWSKYQDFYARAASASKIAYNASRATKEEDFKKFVAELRVGCDSCHGLYLKGDAK